MLEKEIEVVKKVGEVLTVGLSVMVMALATEYTRREYKPERLLEEEALLLIELQKYSGGTK